MDFMKHLQRIAAVTAAVMLFAPAAFAAERAISHNELIDKLSGFWIGQLLGNYIGFPFENRYVKTAYSNPRRPYLHRRL